MRYILAGIVIIGTATLADCFITSIVEALVYLGTIASSLLVGAIKKEESQ